MLFFQTASQNQHVWHSLSTVHRQNAAASNTAVLWTFKKQKVKWVRLYIMYTILSIQYITANSIKGCQATLVEFTIWIQDLVENQSRGHAKKVKCSWTSKRVRAHKSRQKTLRLNTHSKSWNMFAPPARGKRLQWKTAFNPINLSRSYYTSYCTVHSTIVGWQP